MKYLWCAFALMMPLGCKEPAKPAPAEKPAVEAPAAAASQPKAPAAEKEMPAALQEDFEAKADAEITDDNFEAELDALAKEIDADDS